VANDRKIKENKLYPTKFGWKTDTY